MGDVHPEGSRVSDLPKSATVSWGGVEVTVELHPVPEVENTSRGRFGTPPIELTRWERSDGEMWMARTEHAEVLDQLEGVTQTIDGYGASAAEALQQLDKNLSLVEEWVTSVRRAAG
jgi:hypothetical protein